MVHTAHGRHEQRQSPPKQLFRRLFRTATGPSANAAPAETEQMLDAPVNPLLSRNLLRGLRTRAHLHPRDLGPKYVPETRAPIATPDGNLTAEMRKVIRSRWAVSRGRTEDEPDIVFFAREPVPYDGEPINGLYPDGKYVDKSALVVDAYQPDSDGFTKRITVARQEGDDGHTMVRVDRGKIGPVPDGESLPTFLVQEAGLSHELTLREFRYLEQRLSEVDWRPVRDPRA